MPELTNIPENISKTDLIKYLNVILALLNKIKNTSKTDVEETKKELMDLILNFQAIPGPKGEKGDKGEMGPPGKDGYTPIPGIDYELPKDGKDGRDGQNGKDADTTGIAEFATKQAILEILPLIPMAEELEQELVKNLPKYGEQYRDGLELLKGDERLTIEAIKNLREELDELRKYRGNALSSGVVGGGFNYASLDNHLVDDETPTNTGDDLNFTIAHIPSPASSLKVYRNGQRLRITEDYTFSGQTITLLIAKLSGEVLLCDYRI